MFSRRITLSLVRGGIDKNITYEEFNKDMDLLIGKDNDNIDTQAFKTYCDSRRTKAKQLKDEWVIKDLIKRKVKPDGNPYEDIYPLPRLPSKYPKEENQDEYPNPRKRKYPYPAIKNGVVDLQEFLNYLEGFAVFSKRVFNREKIIKLLKSNTWRALNAGEGKLSPIIMTKLTELLMS